MNEERASVCRGLGTCELFEVCHSLTILWMKVMAEVFAANVLQEIQSHKGVEKGPTGMVHHVRCVFHSNSFNPGAAMSGPCMNACKDFGENPILHASLDDEDQIPTLIDGQDSWEDEVEDEQVYIPRYRCAFKSEDVGLILPHPKDLERVHACISFQDIFQYEEKFEEKKAFDPGAGPNVPGRWARSQLEVGLMLPHPRLFEECLKCHTWPQSFHTDG